VELYGRVRRAVLVEGRSQRAVAREFGISRDMVGKMLRYGPRLRGFAQTPTDSRSACIAVTSATRDPHLAAEDCVDVRMCSMRRRTGLDGGGL
jgi:hypothetical protein